jgi:hypothetical protein
MCVYEQLGHVYFSTAAVFRDCSPKYESRRRDPLLAGLRLVANIYRKLKLLRLCLQPRYARDHAARGMALALCR